AHSRGPRPVGVAASSVQICPLADLSFTRITYLSKLIGMKRETSCLSPKASRWLVKFVLDEFVPLLPRYSALWPHPFGSAQALFKNALPFLSCHSNYLGYIDLDYTLTVRRIFPSINVI
ncbi:hypothetical protein, partial [Pectobacterium atrosepticum]|uniref:hypothetical protein n=2 Tax=Pectobacterium atrosepticum TaxID=29471 RepID=UPI001A93A3D8